MTIQILDEAQEDLLYGAYFYDQQSPGLGLYFLNALLTDIESLQIHAGVHVQFFGYHRMLCKRFPYAVYYLCELETIRVYAILDCRRSPKTNTEKLSQR